MSYVYNKAIAANLAKIRGQLTGIEKMIEGDRRCEDILVQLSAAESAMTSAAKRILEEHLRNCLIRDIEMGMTDGAIDELIASIHFFERKKREGTLADAGDIISEARSEYIRGAECAELIRMIREAFDIAAHVAQRVFEKHMNHCVRESIDSGEESIEKLSEVISYYLKMC